MNDLYYFMIINISTFIFFILSIFIRHYKNNDYHFLKKKQPQHNIDLWKIGHFVHYSLLGFYSQSLWFIILAGSILFEFFEKICSKFSKYVIAHTDTDPIINTLGFLFGVIIQKFLR